MGGHQGFLDLKQYEWRMSADCVGGIAIVCAGRCAREREGAGTKGDHRAVTSILIVAIILIHYSQYDM